MHLASIVFPSRNRKAELQSALRAALAQSVPVEVIVADDGSTDGTPDMIRNNFPEVILLELGQGRGPCFQRNRGIERASCAIVFPIDDDSILVDASIVESTLEDFAEPRVGAVGIPFINVNLESRVQQQPPEKQDIFVTAAFVGCAHAVRKDLFLNLGGYREDLFYMGEEDDFCVRMLNAGYVVRLGTSTPLHHLQSKSRVSAWADYYGRKNGILFAWQNVPIPALIYFLPMHLVKALLYSFRTAGTLNKLKGIVDGLKKIRHVRREPIDAAAFRLFRAMRRKNLTTLQEIKSTLTTLQTK